MAQQVRLATSFFLVLILFLACNFIADEPKLRLSADNASLNKINDVIFYKNEPFTGLIYELYPNSKDTVSINNFKDGRPDGVSKKFYPENELKEIRYYKDGLKEGQYLAFWPDGKKQSEYFFKDGEYEGVYKEWNREGRLIQEMHYQKGYEVGSQKMFYDDGKIRCNYQMINGRRYGLLGTKNCVNVSDSVFVK